MMRSSNFTKEENLLLVAQLGRKDSGTSLLVRTMKLVTFPFSKPKTRRKNLNIGHTVYLGTEEVK